MFVACTRGIRDCLSTTSQQILESSQSAASKIRIVWTEAFCTLTKILPNALCWWYRKVISHEISSFSLTDVKINSVALLNLHGKIDKETNGKALLLLHGDHGHPYTMLHLADAAKKEFKGAVFSLYLPYSDEFPENHRQLFKQAVDKIEKLLKENERGFQGLLVVGHSRGGIESAYSAFVEKEPRIAAVISIAGRLKIDEESRKTCHPNLQSTVDKIYEAILTNPHIPLYQIAAEKDWNAPVEATAVRLSQDYCHIIKGAMHLNVLFYRETVEALTQFVRHACAIKV
jgi:hypothetical protein